MNLAVVRVKEVKIGRENDYNIIETLSHSLQVIGLGQHLEGFNLTGLFFLIMVVAFCMEWCFSFTPNVLIGQSKKTSATY
ncbi:hypothetical protein NPIL_287751 [Nephila pilipes]|uniref:Uncharacterized protein n=1 Tax=Nephila pilipes TaxID=299642 RepID=A0A8X6QZD6_NEPPI|nr:hypothetical protein NPIL_287751 [Nephila pilipes]